MCGRYVSVAADADLSAEFDVEEVLDDPPAPSWNVAPTDPVRIIAQPLPRGGERSTSDGAPAAARRQLRTARWGLVPSWSKDMSSGARMINARIETVTEKPAFRRAAAQRRCLVPALGYYEWQRAGTSKVPHFLHDSGAALLAMAGLYEFWRDPALPDDDPARWLTTCTIITRPASDALGGIHDRTPVLVPAELRAQWLDCSDGELDSAARVLALLPEPHLEPRIVGAAVGNVRNNGPDLIEPVPSTEPGSPGETPMLW